MDNNTSLNDPKTAESKFDSKTIHSFQQIWNRIKNKSKEDKNIRDKKYKLKKKKLKIAKLSRKINYAKNKLNKFKRKK